jgi:hypothetical protein
MSSTHNPPPYPPPPFDAMQVASLFTAHVPEPDDSQRTLREIAADTRWLRAEMHCLEAAIDNLAKSLASLVDALAAFTDPEDQDDPAMTLDGDPAGQPRDQDSPL